LSVSRPERANQRKEDLQPAAGLERIRKVIAIKKYLRQHPEVTLAVEACKKEGFKDAIHLAPKDLRDYFCTEIAANSDDATSRCG
jgi:hypothetical protein